MSTLAEFWQLDAAQQGKAISRIERLSKPGENPCILQFGEGVTGQTCQGCVHLRFSAQYRNRYWKCDLRPLTHGKATDHRINWPACSRYEKREGEYRGG